MDSELEKVSQTMAPSAITYSLGNSGLLSLDAVAEKTPLYTELLHTYKWSNKVLNY